MSYLCSRKIQSLINQQKIYFTKMKKMLLVAGIAFAMMACCNKTAENENQEGSCCEKQEQCCEKDGNKQCCNKDSAEFCRKDSTKCCKKEAAQCSEQKAEEESNE